MSKRLGGLHKATLRLIAVRARESRSVFNKTEVHHDHDNATIVKASPWTLRVMEEHPMSLLLRRHRRWYRNPTLVQSELFAIDCPN